MSLPKDEATLSWCADYVLAPIEIQSYESLSGLARKKEWLLGRIAAKEAVRTLASKLFSIDLCSADVVIFVNEDGKPFVVKIDVADHSWQPHISISHKDGTAIAIAVDPNSSKSVGIDLESISPREEGFERLALTEQERVRFESELATGRDLFLAKSWSAKEAAGKALGDGLAGNPKNFEILEFDSSSCRLATRLTASLQKSNFANNHSSSTITERICQAHYLQIANQVLSMVTID
jgi:phosphopantetheine--protein transferase-like protein